MAAMAAMNQGRCQVRDDVADATGWADAAQDAVSALQARARRGAASVSTHALACPAWAETRPAALDRP